MHCLCQLSYLLPTAESSDHPSPNFAQEIPLMQHGQPQSDQAVGLGGRYKPPQIKYFILLYSKPKIHFLALSTVEFCPVFPFSLFWSGLSPWHAGRRGSAGRWWCEPGPGAHSSTGKIPNLTPQLPLAGGKHKPERCWRASVYDRFIFLGRMNWQITVSESDWASTSLVLSDTPQFLGFYVIQVSVSHQ